MLASNIPAKFPIAFASSAGGGYIRAIPTPSQIPITPGAASLTDGFPPLCFLQLAVGGVPPFGEDFNGLFKQITSWNQWQSAGGPVKWDAVFSAAIGGYPQGALIASATTLGAFWMSTVDNNVTNPDAGGAGWISLTTLNGNYVIDTGAANAYVVALPLAITSYQKGLTLIVQFSHNGTGASTINAGGGAVGLLRTDGSATQNGDIFNGMTAEVVCVANGGPFRFTSLVYSQFGTAARANASAATGTVAAVTGGPFTIGDMAVFADVNGTIADGGSFQGITQAPLYMLGKLL